MIIIYSYHIFFHWASEIPITNTIFIYVVQWPLIYPLQFNIYIFLTMQPEHSARYQPGEESHQKEEDIKNWVQANGPEIKEIDSYRLKYYAKLDIQPPKLQKEETIEKDETSMSIYTPQIPIDPYRQRYYNKLKKMNILREVPQKKFQHLFIFDWDDTLLCTDYLNKLHFINITQETKNYLVRLDQVVVKLLNLTLQRGDVFIITNATDGWVQYSSRLYMPNTHEIIEETSKNKKMKIISARSKYGNEYPGDYGKWKMQAFKSILNDEIDPDLLTNMICMGDSNFEIEAAIALGKMFDEAVVKTIKFRSNPKPQEMIKQILLVVDKFIEIFNNNKNLTIRLERKKTEKSVEKTIEQKPTETPEKSE